MMRQRAATGDAQRETVALECGPVLRALRAAAGVTQAGWAARLGYGRRTIQRWERGEGTPDEAAAEALVRLCGDLRLYRSYRQGALAGVIFNADYLRDLLADARLRERARPAPAATEVERTAAPSHNLPAELTSFIGRERELVAIGRQLETARLVTLTGAGGVGKTRLALRVAGGLPGRWAAGVWLTELAVLTDPALVPQAVARAVGVREQPGRALEDTLVEALGARRLLLVLDNCEHLVAACAVLIARLLRACSRLHVLATSREVLGVPGEIIWSVSPLAVPTETAPISLAVLAGTEAVRLFVARASAARPDFTLTAQNAAAVTAICCLLDGLPLALELAAARMRTLAPEAIAARLDDRFRLLTGGGRATSSRHQTLRAAIDWSYDLLDSVERHLFDRLAVFAGDFDLAAAEAVCADGEIAAATILDLLARLVDKSIVIADVSGADGVTHYHLLETLRAYGLERLAACGEAELMQRRHAVWAVALAEQAGRAFHGLRQGQWLRRAERIHADVRAALGWALERGKADAALRLGAALWWSWGVHERRNEGRAWLERALALPEAQAPTARRARVLAYLAIFAAFQGNHGAARARLAEADALGRALGDDSAILAACSVRALLLERGDRFDELAPVVDEALALARRLGDVWWTSRLLEMLAHAALRRDEIATAVAWLEEGVRLAQQAGDTWGLATTLAELGDVARARGAYAEAGAYYAESLALREDLGIPGATPSLRHNLGYVALAAGDLAVATAHFTTALHEFSRLGERRGVVECLIGRAAVAASAGEHDVAARLFGAGEAALEALESTIWPSNRPDYERAVARVRMALAADTFAAAWAEGRRLSLEQAVTLALD
jgi:predicted ATPase/transcriptional regulator with XRE-family HTH domain